MKRIFALAVLLAASTAAPVVAQKYSDLSTAFSTCIGRAGSNTVQRDICAQREVGSQDDRLNKAYQHVLRQLASDPVQTLALRDQEQSGSPSAITPARSTATPSITA